MFTNNSPLNISQGLSVKDFFPSSTKMNLNNRHISISSPATNAYNQNILLTYMNNNKILKKDLKNDLRLSNIKRGKSIHTSFNMSSNNPSTYETSFSNSIFDIRSPQIKNANASNISSNKILVHLRPKSEVNKIKLDIILGYAYFLNEQDKNKKKIDKFIFKLQKKFDKRIEKFKFKNFEIPILRSTNFKNSDNKIINNIINKEIQAKKKLFHKFEKMISIFALIIYYLNKNQKISEAKLIYILIIKQNINHIKYLEEVINFKSLANDKNAKYKINMHRYANLILLKIYSFFIKYGFLFNLSFYGHLFMKMYLALSHKYYIYSLYLNKNKYSTNDSIKKTKTWFSLLNYYSAHFSIANYSPMKLPIYLYDTVLNIFNTIDEQNIEDRYFTLCTKYNKSLILYLNGENDEAINVLKDIKINLFGYIEDKDYQKEKGNYTNKNKSFMIQTLTDAIEKKTNLKINQNSVTSSFNKLFVMLNTKNSKNKSNFNIKQMANMNMKLEPYFVSNTRIDIESFVDKFYNLFSKSSLSSRRGKKEKTSNNPDSKPFSYSSFLRQNTYQSSQNIPLKNIPNIFKNPILIRSELLIAEIELDKKHFRLAYTFTNHALAIISLLKKIQNSSLTNKFKIEQKYIKEFLNIIDNVNIITESDFEEKEEEEEKENAKEIITIRTKEYNKAIEFKERVNLNKKVLKELEKFFIFFTTLSIYQIKVLNETQPKTNIRNDLPILFQNQFKDCLSLRQNIALENLDIMSLSRYMILKDPNKPIFPKNLNISLIYFERPELFGSKYTNIKDLKQKIKEDSNKRAKSIYKQIFKTLKGKTNLIKLFKNNYNIIIKIIQKSTKEEIKDLISNPESLLKPIEQYRKKYNKSIDFDKRGFIRQKSQVINNDIFSGMNSLRLKTDSNINNISNINRGQFVHKSLRNSVIANSRKNHIEEIKEKKMRNSLDKMSKVSRNFIKKEKEIKKKKIVDSYTSTYKLSVVEPESDSD